MPAVFVEPLETNTAGTTNTISDGAGSGGTAKNKNGGGAVPARDKVAVVR